MRVWVITNSHVNSYRCKLISLFDSHKKNNGKLIKEKSIFILVLLESFERSRSVVVYTAMEDTKSAEVLATIFRQLERVELLLDTVLSLQDNINAINETLAIHRRELDKVHKKQNELEQELQIVRNLSQRDERDNNLDERLDLYVQDINETLNYHQGFIESVDKQLRGTNLIFHGVPEKTSVELGSDDIDKIKKRDTENRSH